MDFAIPNDLAEDIERFDAFIKTDIIPELPNWNHKRKLSRTFFHHMGKQGWYGLKFKNGSLIRGSALKESVIAEKLAEIRGETVEQLARETFSNANTLFGLN